jgi:hypothetical protein
MNIFLIQKTKKYIIFDTLQILQPYYVFSDVLIILKNKWFCAFMYVSAVRQAHRPLRSTHIKATFLGRSSENYF